MVSTETPAPPGERPRGMVFPRLSDPRLHLAAVIISIHIVGISALGFRVSVPQILSAILVAGAVDLLVTRKRTGLWVWPASGLLTGSGVALILRLVGMGRGDYWSWSGWHYFAAVAGVSVASKYLIRFRGDHVFNPSNIGLVATFLILGSTVVEPLDFWWAPISFPMALAYLIIIAGGVLITRRLRLLEMAIVFWAVLAAGLGVLAASGHCMTTAWSVTPVCGASFWWVLVTSPEILIFLFFMITDPKTVPGGAVARVGFSAVLAVIASILIAPQTVEFGAKVALLGSLVLLAPVRAAFDRWLTQRQTKGSGALELINRVSLPTTGRGKSFARGMIIGAAVTLMATAIVVAGAPARPASGAATVSGPGTQSVQIDPGSLPSVEIDPSVAALSGDLDAERIEAISVTLAENLAFEREAMRLGDGSLLAYADAGARLTEMQAALDAALAQGTRIGSEYHFSEMRASAADAVGQSGAGLVFDGSGIVETVSYDAFGVEQSRDSDPFDKRFVLRQIGGDRWLLVEVADNTAS